MLKEIDQMREALASYIEATYHLSNAKVVDLRRQLLMAGGIAQIPYIESTPTYLGDRPFAALAIPPRVRDLLTGLASKEAGRVLFNPPYEHQAQALEAAMADNAGGTGIVVTTGTGSGKTESFLLPVLARLADEALHRPNHFADRAVRALLLYPMNALVNDQLGRLRTLFGSSTVRQSFTSAAGRPAKFGRYTGRTLYPGSRSGKRDQVRLKTLEYYLKIEDGARNGNRKDQELVLTLRDKGRWPAKPDSSLGAFDGLRNWYGKQGQHWEDNGDPSRAVERPQDPELLTRHEIQAACPDLLVTNYSMLEYMLLRPIEREIFADTRAFFEAYPNEKFFLILDEAHLYRGANGTEVAYLIRRLLDRLKLPLSRVVFIATSASFSDAEAAKRFVARLSGLMPGAIKTLSGEKRVFEPADGGSAGLAAAFAAVPLAELNSATLTDRSAVLVPLTKFASDVAGATVSLKRMDSGSQDIIVTVQGLDTSGNRIEEDVLVTPSKEAKTSQRFLVVDGARCEQGSVSVARRYGLGTVDAQRFIPTADDLPAALAELLAKLPVIGRLRNITSGAQSEVDQFQLQGAARAFTALPKLLFPEAEAAVGREAVDALLELASLARFTPDDPPILPARVHLLFRGLPGLWACVNPDCTEIPQEQRGGPTGKLYAEPRQNCPCGSQIYELHSCRSCGLSVARASIGAPADFEHLWQENGRSYAGDTSMIESIHVCLEDPMPLNVGAVRLVFLDMSSGKIDGAGNFRREVWLPSHLGPKLFDTCPRCETASGSDYNNGISDLQTKGEQPFQELISVQVLGQQPRPQVRTPLQGRKALVFSDGRQTASRLAGTLKTFSFRDSLRPLLLAGMAALKQPIFKPSLDDAPLAIALGAARHEVRLRPAGDDGKMERAGQQALGLIGNNDAENDDFRTLSNKTSEETQLSVFQSIYAVLQDDHTGLFPTALAVLRPKLTKTEAQKLGEALRLPTITNLTGEGVRAALLELWLWQAMRKHAIKLQHTPANVIGGRGSAGIREWNGKFSRKLTALLEVRGLKQWLKSDYVTACEPALRAVFAPGATTSYFVQASKVSLDVDRNYEWIRCERCTSVSPRNPLLGDRCGYCAGTAKVVDPASDLVFRSRKAFYRRLWERLSDKDDAYAPHQLIAEEHSAALNDSGMANAMSRNEAYELRFQDIPIEQDGQTGSPIDILSCTTTMEVGIDIGGLTAVALRNVPPGRANYQQRAGRAGRRGAGLSTVMMFCGADSHDQSFFRDPAPIIAGPAPEPILNLDNPVIARRQAFAYLIGRFQQDRINTVHGSSDVFSSLGSVTDFVNGAKDVFSLEGLKKWIADGRNGLNADLSRLFTIYCPALDPNLLLNELPCVLEENLTLLTSSEPVVQTKPSPAAEDGDVEDEQMEDTNDDDRMSADNGKLLDTLFDQSLLPKYAFPTDVATFSVFEENSGPWSPKRRYSPQQALNAALSQYAPGHEVWVDGQRYLSLGIYAERDEERLNAYRERRLYYQCRTCNYADLLDWDEGYPEQTRDCPACKSRASLGPARRWIRPPGFSHPPTIRALPPDFDAGMPLRPTKATLDSLSFDSASQIGTQSWPMGTGWEAWTDSRTLVVTNRGSLDATKPGFNYCTHCGRIEPTDFDPQLKQLGGGQPHNRPRPKRPQEPDQCNGVVTRIVLGNEFRTDVAVFRLALLIDWQLAPDRPSTTIAARSAVEALRRAACMLEDLEANDIDGDFRFAPSDGAQQFIDLYLYDQAAGGAGFVKAAARDPQRLVDAALGLLDNCSCDDSCYQCLRSYKNRFEHALFDRRIGADLLRACFKGSTLTIDSGREDYALDRLERDLADSGASTTRLNGGIIDGKGQFICLSHPFRENEPCSERAKALAKDRKTIAVDILLVLRALPIASSVALSIPNVNLNRGLKSDPQGPPELTPAMVVAKDLSPPSDTPRFAVAGTQAGEVLFRITGNMLTGKNGDGQGGTVAKGALCLFRPFSGTPSKTDVYLIRRTDGKAFGSTGAEWTVGILQQTANGVRVRYRAAPQYMECVSELVQPRDAIDPVAVLVRVVG